MPGIRSVITCGEVKPGSRVSQVPAPRYTWALHCERDEPPASALLLNVVRHDEGRPVIPLDVAIGLIIIHEAFGLWIKVQLAPSAIADVCHVDQRCREMTLFDITREVAQIAAAYRFQEILDVRRCVPR